MQEKHKRTSPRERGKIEKQTHGRKNSRRMKQLRRRRRRLIAAMLLILLIPAGGLLLFLNLHPLFLKDDTIELELQGSFDPA